MSLLTKQMHLVDIYSSTPSRIYPTVHGLSLTISYCAIFGSFGLVSFSVYPRV